MKTFSISDIEAYTGIKAHTIRTWEKRYSLVNSQRGLGNVRYYLLEDIRFLLKLCVLNKSGMKISNLAKMDTTRIDAALEGLFHEPAVYLRDIHQLIISMLTMDTETFDAVLATSIRERGMDVTIDAVILPFMESARIISCKNCDGTTDFVVAALRHKLMFAIEQLDPPRADAKSALLFLPEKEYYDLTLLYTRYKLKQSGLKTIYLGSNISMEKLKSVTALKNPERIVTYLGCCQERKKTELQREFDNWGRSIEYIDLKKEGRGRRGIIAGE